jgi:hypothetical protein
VSELNRIHKHAQWVQGLVTRTREHQVAHCILGLLIVTTEKGKAIEISYSDARSLIFVLEFHIVITRNVFSFCAYNCHPFIILPA